jgi:hypothetical protein
LLIGRYCKGRHEMLEHLTLKGPQFPEARTREAHTQKATLPEPVIAMAVEKTLALELAHALYLYVGLVIIGLVVLQYVLDEGGIRGNNSTSHPAKIEGERRT